MSETNSPVTSVKPTTKKREVEEKTFSMNFWEDERLARKAIKENLMFIAQKSNDRGVKAHFSRTKDNGDGTQTLEVQFAETEEKVNKDGSKETKHVFSGNNYLKVTYDPARKFPKSTRKVEGDEDAPKKEKLRQFVKFR